MSTKKATKKNPSTKKVQATKPTQLDRIESLLMKVAIGSRDQAKWLTSRIEQIGILANNVARPNGSGTWTVSVCDRDNFTVIPD